MLSKKKLLGSVLILVIIGVVGYNYIYQDHRNIEKESAEFTMTAMEIANLFKEDAINAEQTFLNKTIEVIGNVSDSDKSEITLNNQVFCQFVEAIKEIKHNENIKIKGRVIGYDDLLEQVKLDQCSIIKIE
jgi:antitoxin component YwqK of YwqJK toxin-antitoxin module